MYRNSITQYIASGKTKWYSHAGKKFAVSFLKRSARWQDRTFPAFILSQKHTVQNISHARAQNKLNKFENTEIIPSLCSNLNGMKVGKLTSTWKLNNTFFLKAIGFKKKSN